MVLKVFHQGTKQRSSFFLLISYHLHDVRVGLPPESIFVRFKLILMCAHLKDVGWLMEARCTFPSAASEAQYGVISLRWAGEETREGALTIFQHFIGFEIRFNP